MNAVCLSCALTHRDTLCCLYCITVPGNTHWCHIFRRSVKAKKQSCFFLLWRAYQWPSGQTVSISQPLATTSRPTQIKSQPLRTRGLWKIQTVELLKTVFVLSSSRANQGETLQTELYFIRSIWCSTGTKVLNAASIPQRSCVCGHLHH